MLNTYKNHAQERAASGLPPLPLNAEQTAELVDLLRNPPLQESALLLELISERVPAGVDEAAYVKASFLTALVKGETTSPLIDPFRAIELLGTMQGGYNVDSLVALFDDDTYAEAAAVQLKHTILMFEAFHDVVAKSLRGNLFAAQVLRSWAEAEWFLRRPAVKDLYTLTIFKVSGETNTDDLSPATDVWSRPDIPLHARSMLKNPRDGVQPDEPGVVGPLALIQSLKAQGNPIAYVGDVVGTGSSRKSAINSILWHFGDDIAHVPNKRLGGFCFASKIAPIFYNTLEDAGGIPLEFDVSALQTGDVIDLYLRAGRVCKHSTGEVVGDFRAASEVLLDQVRAGGRIPLIIGRALTEKARDTLGLGPTEGLTFIVVWPASKRWSVQPGTRLGCAFKKPLVRIQASAAM